MLKRQLKKGLTNLHFMSCLLDYELQHSDCRFDQLVEYLALHDPLYMNRVRNSGTGQTVNQVNTVNIDDGNQCQGGVRSKTGKNYQNANRQQSSNNGTHTPEAWKGMQARVNQLENQLKQAKANTEAWKQKKAGKGNENSRPSWNNSGNRQNKFKGKKNFPLKKKNQNQKGKPSGDGNVNADKLVCWKCYKTGHDDRLLSM